MWQVQAARVLLQRQSLQSHALQASAWPPLLGLVIQVHGVASALQDVNRTYPFPAVGPQGPIEPPGCGLKWSSCPLVGRIIGGCVSVSAAAWLVSSTSRLSRSSLPSADTKQQQPSLQPGRNTRDCKRHGATACGYRGKRRQRLNAKRM